MDTSKAYDDTKRRAINRWSSRTPRNGAPLRSKTGEILIRCLNSLGILVLVTGSVLTAHGQEASSVETAAEPAGPQKYALLVGINDYAEIKDLKYCGRDIEVLRERLIEAGFPEANLTLLHDGAKESLHQPFKISIQHHLDELVNRAGADDLIVFAFSGHGVELDGTSYLCPIEGQLDAHEETLISLETVYQRLRSSKARQKLLLIDACRDDPRPGGEKSLVKAPNDVTGFARSLDQPPEGILVLSSCRPGQVSVEDDQMGHGVFLHFILKGLHGDADREGGNGNGRVSLFELYRYADLKTRTYVARTRDLVQTPVLRGQASADFEVARVVSRTEEIETVWTHVRENPEMFVESSPVMQWFRRMYQRQMEGTLKSISRLPAAYRQGMTMESMMGMVNKMLHDPQAIVTANPSVITANDSEALLAMQRSYAFGIRGDWNGAIAAATEAIQREPENPFAYLLRGMAYSGKETEMAGLASMLDSAESNPQYAVRMLQDVDNSPYRIKRFINPLSELARDDPDLVDLLAVVRGNSNMAQQNPTRTLELVKKALAQLRKSNNLVLAIDDFRKAGVGLLVSVEKDTPLQVGGEVVAKVTGYFQVFEADRVNDDWVYVKWTDDAGEKQQAWVKKDQVRVSQSYFQLFQMVLQ